MSNDQISPQQIEALDYVYGHRLHLAALCHPYFLDKQAVLDPFCVLEMGEDQWLYPKCMKCNRRLLQTHYESKKHLEYKKHYESDPYLLSQIIEQRRQIHLNDDKLAHLRDDTAPEAVVPELQQLNQSQNHCHAQETKLITGSDPTLATWSGGAGQNKPEDAMSSSVPLEVQMQRSATKIADEQLQQTKSDPWTCWRDVTSSSTTAARGSCLQICTQSCQLQSTVPAWSKDKTWLQNVPNCALQMQLSRTHCTWLTEASWTKDHSRPTTQQNRNEFNQSSSCSSWSSATPSLTTPWYSQTDSTEGSPNLAKPAIRWFTEPEAVRSELTTAWPALADSADAWRNLGTRSTIWCSEPEAVRTDQTQTHRHAEEMTIRSLSRTTLGSCSAESGQNKPQEIMWASAAYNLPVTRSGTNMADQPVQLAPQLEGTTPFVESESELIQSDPWTASAWQNATRSQTTPSSSQSESDDGWTILERWQ